MCVIYLINNNIFYQEVFDPTFSYSAMSTCSNSSKYYCFQDEDGDKKGAISLYLILIDFRHSGSIDKASMIKIKYKSERHKPL